MLYQLNTQGGARKNENSQALDVHGDVIPNLYVVGELGGIAANLYQGATNMAECLVFGKITDNDKINETPNVSLDDNQYLGTGSGFNGKIYVVVTFAGDAIADIEIISHTETDGVSDPAFAQVTSNIIDAQSTEVDTATGATYSSKGIIEAVNDVIAQHNS